MKIKKLVNPKFLICEDPINEPNRTFVYCVQYLSLIEVWNLEIPAAYPKEQVQKQFIYKSITGKEFDFLLVFTQNNVKIVVDELIVGGNPELEILEDAWKFFSECLDREEQNRKDDN